MGRAGMGGIMNKSQVYERVVLRNGQWDTYNNAFVWLQRGSTSTSVEYLIELLEKVKDCEDINELYDIQDELRDMFGW